MSSIINYFSTLGQECQCRLFSYVKAPGCDDPLRCDVITGWPSIENILLVQFVIS